MSTKAKPAATPSEGDDDNSEKLAGKKAYIKRLTELVNTYSKILIVQADNVGSSQMQKIRISLRGSAVVLMGKNTLIRKALRAVIEKNPLLDNLLPLVRGNIGFVFTKGDLSSVMQKVVGLRVEAPAKVGVLAPNNVVVPAGPTGLEPTQTSFLQALNIPSKINKGQVEIINDHQLLKKGDKVGQSEAALLQKLNIKPFTYGLVVSDVYDEGVVYESSVLLLKDEDLLEHFVTGVRNVAALGLQTSFPTTAAVPHLLSHAYRNLLAIAASTDVTFKRAEPLKAYLKDPSAFAATSAPAAEAKPDEKKGGDKGGKKEEKKKEEKKEEVPPPADDDAGGDMGLSLFD